MAYPEAYKAWWDQMWGDACSTARALCMSPFEEGLVLSVLRICWIPYVVFHFATFWMLVSFFGGLILLCTGWWSGTAPRVKGLWYILVDLYSVLWTITLILCFNTAYDALASTGEIGGEDWSKRSFTVPAALAALRVYEIVSFIGAIYAQGSYQPFSKERAVVNTFWHYKEAILAFATVYICVAYVYGGTFGKIEECDKRPDRNLAMCKSALAGDPITPCISAP
jgi:hypothetical protein